MLKRPYEKKIKKMVANCNFICMFAKNKKTMKISENIIGQYKSYSIGELACVLGMKRQNLENLIKAKKRQNDSEIILNGVPYSLVRIGGTIHLYTKM